MGRRRRFGDTMYHVKPLEDLTLMDDYMFSVVMRDEANLKPLLETILGIEIRELGFIEPQRVRKEGYASRGVRLDLYVVDGEGRIFNVEVQASSEKDLPKRMRYYQSVIDVDVLAPGVDYGRLNRSVVVFICDYDPFGRGRYVYTFENACLEVPGLSLGDETQKVVACTVGSDDEAGDELRALMSYLGGAQPASDLARQLDGAVARVKASEERRHEYMIAMIHDMEMREEGREEERLSAVRNVMASLGVGADEAMGILGIPEPERPACIEGLQQNSPQSE